MTHFSLFTGIGGLDLAAEMAGLTTVGQCEWADYPTKVLEKHWPDVPRWRDVTKLTGKEIQDAGIGEITVLSAGFPCQPHSLSGKRLASDDERDLWSECVRLLHETGAKGFVGENVPGLLSSDDGRFFGRVLRDLDEMGCHVFWMCFPAHAVGTQFWGERVAIVVSTDCQRFHSLAEKLQSKPKNQYSEILGGCKARPEYLQFFVARSERDPSGGLPRNDDGVPGALDRLKAIGNAVVPQQFYPVFRAIADLETMAQLEAVVAV